MTLSVIDSQTGAAASLPVLDDQYAVTPSEVAEYRERGHTIIRGLCSPAEILAYRPAINDAASRFNVEKRALQDRDTYGKAFLQIMNLWEKDEAVRRFTFAKRFAKVAADLMGVSGVRLYHDQALFKEPGGGPTPWHQDQFYWPLGTDNTITLWMPLVDIPAEVGSMTFGSGSHRTGYLGDHGISDASEDYFANFVRDNGIELNKYGAMKAGDATYHAGWTLHAAPNNPTPNMREVMTIIYFADGTKVTEPDNENQESDRQAWLCNTAPGEPAASERNPLLYASDHSAFEMR